MQRKGAAQPDFQKKVFVIELYDFQSNDKKLFVSTFCVCVNLSTSLCKWILLLIQVLLYTVHPLA